MKRIYNIDMNNAGNKTVANILSATRRANGDFYATVRELGRFCSEAVIDAATETPVDYKYSCEFPKYRRATRDESIMRLAGWANQERNREWGKAFRATRAAAIKDLPEALEQLGAAL